MALPPEPLESNAFVSDLLPEEERDKLPVVQQIILDHRAGHISFEEASAQLIQLVGTDEPLKRMDLLKLDLSRIRPPPVTGYRRKARRWTTEEDQRLVNAVQLHGTENWPLVASCVGGNRTRSQCSQRWHRVLDPKISKCNWSREEEEKLLRAVDSFGNKAWTRIAAEMGNRCDVQCRFRYNFLKKKAKESGTLIQPISAPMSMTQRQDLPEAEPQADIVNVTERQVEDVKVDPEPLPETKD